MQLPHPRVTGRYESKLEKVPWNFVHTKKYLLDALYSPYKCWNPSESAIQGYENNLANYRTELGVLQRAYLISFECTQGKLFND